MVRRFYHDISDYYYDISCLRPGESATIFFPRTRKDRTRRRLAHEVYEGLRRVVGRRHISRFLETLARPHVVLTDVDAAYAAMAADEAREKDALEWAEGTVGDIAGSEGYGDESG